MRAVILRLLLPLLALVILELAFRAGAWESMTPTLSHVGKSARITRAMEGWPGRIDFVTIGDSRSKHGLDHEMIAAEAKRQGYAHAKLSIPGASYLTEILLFDYLRTNHPDTQGGVIATSLPALLYTGGGNHELAIAQPLSPLIGRHQALIDRFDRKSPPTWGAVSALYQYRSYISDFMQQPLNRLSELEQENYSHEKQLFTNSPQRPNACRVDWNDLSSCAAYDGDNARAIYIANICKTWLSRAASGRANDRFTREPLHPAQLKTLEMRQAQFRALDWPRPPLVVLMPVSHLWYEELAPDGADEWAHRIFDPLVAEGKIHLLDYSHFFNEPGDRRCDAWTDPYHQSEKGMRELTEDLLPKISRLLYLPAQANEQSAPHP